MGKLVCILFKNKIRCHIIKNRSLHCNISQIHKKINQIRQKDKWKYRTRFLNFEGLKCTTCKL